MSEHARILDEVLLKDGWHLLIRNPVIEDAEKIIEYMNVIGGESDNLLRGANEFELTREQEIERIKRDNGDPDTYMIVGTIDGRIAAIAQIQSSARKRIAHNAELAISVKKEFWRCGVGTAIMQHLINHAKDSGMIRNINLGVKAGNTNARKLYEKFGFEMTGVHKDFFNVNGVFDDEILMDLHI